jgi:hypothetical protein
MFENNLTYAEAAKRLGVTPQQLKSFAGRKKPLSQLRKDFNRSPAYRKLYEEPLFNPRTHRTRTFKRLATRPADVFQLRYRFEGIRRAGSEEELRRQLIYSELIQEATHRRPNATWLQRYKWAEYALEHHLPISKCDIQKMHAEGALSDTAYDAIIQAFQEIYSGAQWIPCGIR